MKLVLVDKSNVDLAIKIQNEIFPEEDGQEELLDTVNSGKSERMSLLKYWICYTDNIPIGICGITQYADYPDDAWLGWYGVRQGYRRNGFGRKMFYYVKQLAKQMGYKHLRLYTDEEDNKVAIITYRKYGMYEEVYNNPNDKTIFFGRTLIFSLPLGSNKFEPWNDRYIFLNEEFEAEERSKNSKSKK